METLLWNLALCLFAFFMPIVLFVYTLVSIGQHRPYIATKSLVLLNIFLALALLSTVILMHLSTLATMAIGGYLLVAVVYVSIRSVILWGRLWKVIQRRMSGRKLGYVDPETAFLSSTYR